MNGTLLYDLYKDTETFSNIWTEYRPNLNEFCIAYEKDILKYGNKKGMVGKPNIPANNFTVSMIAWTTFGTWQ